MSAFSGRMAVNMKTTMATKTTAAKAVSHKSKKWGKRQTILLCMFLPAAILLFVFCYIPMYGIIIAFKDYSLFKGIFGSQWAGFKYFRYFLTDPQFWFILKNTIILNAYDLVFGFTSPIIFALLVNEVMAVKFKKVVQTISYMPNFFSWIVVAGLLNTMLSPDANGIINMILVQLFGIKPIYFLAESTLFRPIAVIADMWKNTGFSAIVYFAAIAGIDSELYDAAAIDGAKRLKLVRHVTLPGIAPMIMIMLIFRISGIFSIGFDRVFLLQNSLNLEVSEVISTYTYKLGIIRTQFSLTTAIGLVQSFIGLVLLYAANASSRKIAGMGLY